MRVQVTASVSLLAALLGISTPAFSQGVYRVVPHQSDGGARIHAPNGQTYTIYPNYGMQQYGRNNVPSSYTIMRVPGGNGDLGIR